MTSIISRLLITFAFLVGLLVLVQNILTQNHDLSQLDGVEATKAVTIDDLQAKNIPNPIRTKVSVPGFSYKRAFPDATDEPEITVKQYGESPELKKRTQLPKSDPNWLPPVEERLPLYPAVVTGPDGIGQYGNDLYMATKAWTHFEHKTASEPLLRMAPSGDLQPNLAYKWEKSADNRVYTFYVRKGIRWSDGEPLKPSDFSFMTNILNESAYWPGPPDWMQPINATVEVIHEDISDYGALASAILDAAKPRPSETELAPEASTPSEQLWSKASERFKELTKSIINESENKALQVKWLIELNKILKDPSYYKAEAWAQVDFEAEIKQYEAVGYTQLSKSEKEHYLLLLERRNLLAASVDDLEAEKYIRRNVSAFRAAYRKWVDKSAKYKVVITAKETDDAIVVSYAFKRPNAFFLDRIGTYMFHKLNLASEHFHGPYHPEHSIRFDANDILNLPTLVKQLIASPAQTPAAEYVSKRLPQSLIEQLRSTPTKDLGKGYGLYDGAKPELVRQIVDAINASLHRKDFYNAEAWKDLPFDAEKKAYDDEGYAFIIKEFFNKRRYRELLRRQDYLKRVQQDGIDVLSATELYDFNQMMLRMAFPEALTLNRETALNEDANRGTPSYDSWVRKLWNKARFVDDKLNPHIPTLRAWRVITPSQATEAIAVRNAYYFKVDKEGNQLPYIDRIVNPLKNDSNLIQQTLIAGKADFQTRDLEFSRDYKILKQNEKNGNYRVELWPLDYVGHINFTPLQSHKDPDYAKLQTEPRFRHALSLALNRQEIIDIAFNGLGTPAQTSIPKGSPYYSEKLATAFVDYDPERANQLLDEIGLNERNKDGVRLYPNSSKPIFIELNYDKRFNPVVLQMAAAYWRAVGINAQPKIKTREYLQQLLDIGESDITIAAEGGVYMGPAGAGHFAPTHPAESLADGRWVKWLRTGGRSGVEPPQYIIDINRLWKDAEYASSEAEKFEKWHELMDVAAYQLKEIGLMIPPGQPVYISNRMRNVPEMALCGWIAHEPSNCCPEVFYIVDTKE